MQGLSIEHLSGAQAFEHVGKTHPFFHASAWCLDALVRYWSYLVLRQQVAVTAHGRAVLPGDHTAVVKDARRMSGVVTLHQDSETQSKPNDYRGHDWGVVGFLVGSLSNVRK
ncbi:MAG: hypothetical protein V3S24_14205 [Candidatus Tectomicrobia bacterium]